MRVIPNLGLDFDPDVPIEGEKQERAFFRGFMEVFLGALKIAYLVASNELSGGLRVVLQQAEELADRGHSITIVCPNEEPDWYSLRKPGWETSPFESSKALEFADVCVATFWTTVPPAVGICSRPVFHLCQGYEADFSFYASKRREIKSVYAQPTHKLAVSPNIEKRLKAAGYAPVTYIGQAFDPQEFPVAEERRFNQHPPRILLVGIFGADVKGIREALEALAELQRSGVEFKLHRVSPLPQSEREHNIFPAHDYSHRLLPSQMGAAYRNSDLLIGPSHPEEGFGLPVLEALSSGLPVLLSDTPGHRHIARDAAAYFPWGDISTLASQIAALLQNPARRAELSAKGPIEATRFRTADVADRLLGVFTKALARP
ncbi:MAG: glycosyltransferase family 4 protein [Deltaproteobacteria bacterium]|nr:glycosyltransferase family 4 protein [Deltaproteobacteria bacterium]